MPEIVCENIRCGKTKHISPRAFNRSKHHFCSKPCHLEWRRERAANNKKKTLGELFMKFINGSSLIDEQKGCFHGLQSIDSIQMYTKKDGKTFVFHAEGKRKE